MDNNKLVDLYKRIKILDFQLKQKKALVEKELLIIEGICNELISLKVQYEKLGGKEE